MMSSGSGATLGALRRNLISPFPVAWPARFLKKSAGSLYDSDFLGNGYNDPLVQGHAVLLG
jgi:hypothetical protein